MIIVRALALLVACASLCVAGQPRTSIHIQQHRPAEKHSCALAIVAVDGKRLSSPQQQVSFPPGKHNLTIRVRALLGATWYEADAPLQNTFKPHRYMLDGEFSQNGKLRLILEDEDERPPGVKTTKTK